MTTFHIRDNGDPGRCVAQPGNCRFGSSDEHYTSIDEARNAFEEKAKSLQVPSSQKSKKRNRNELSFDERFGPDDRTKDVLELNGLKLDVEKLKDEFGIKELQAYGFAGSQLYGLNTESSDTDLAVISEGKGRDQQKIVGDMDFRIYPIDKMMNRLWKSSVPETDLLFSRTLNHLTHTHEDLLKNFRLNSLKYYDNSVGLAMTHLPRITADIKTERRQYKALKASARSILLAHKMLKQREDFNPVFTDLEKQHYWDLMDRMTERFTKGDDWNDIYLNIHAEGKSLHKSS